MIPPPTDADRALDIVKAWHCSVLVDPPDAFRTVLRLLAEERRLREAAEAKLSDIERFMEAIRVKARGRNPEGATILDFMTVWNEQYEARIAELEAQLALAVKVLEPFAQYPDSRGDAMPDETLMDERSSLSPTLGDCRRAAAIRKGDQP